MTDKLLEIISNRSCNSYHLFQIFLIIFLSITNTGFKVYISYSQTTIRIVDGIDKFSEPNPYQLIEPASFYGPDSLFLLKGLCFTKNHERNEYTLCPFQNITSKRTSGTQKPSLLGIWGKWLLDSTVSSEINTGNTDRLITYNKMSYFDGQSCGHSTKSVVVNVLCESSGDIALVNVNDVSHCEYQMDLAIPFSCDVLRSEVHTGRISHHSSEKVDTVTNNVVTESKPSTVNESSNSGGSNSSVSISNRVGNESCTCPITDDTVVNKQGPNGTMNTLSSTDLISLRDAVTVLQSKILELQLQTDAIMALLSHSKQPNKTKV